MVRSILHVDLDAFFVSVEQALRPELYGKPVIVGGQPDRRGVVAAASYEARAFGIHSAMPLIKAYRLCPHAVFLEGNFQRYREFSAKFMAILADFSPDVESGGLDEAYLDVTGCDIFGTPHQIAVKIKQRVHDELGIVASVGIATSKVVAKIASDFQKPDGLVEVPAGQEREFLSPLPIGKLPGVGKKTELYLKQRGISTMGQIASLKPQNALVLLGSSGMALYYHAQGIDDRRIATRSGVKSISRETTFAQDVVDIRMLQAVLRYLSERVGAELRRNGQFARTVALKLRYSDFTTISRQTSLDAAVDIDEIIFDRAAALLDQALKKDHRPVRLIGIGITNFTSGQRQLSLDTPALQRMERVDKAIDRIRQKYGFTAVQTGRTMLLKDIFTTEGNDYMLDTPSLSR